MKRITLEWVSKAEGDYAVVEHECRIRKNRNNDAICFHAQQCAEKYLKARLSEAGIGFPKIHDLTILLNMARKLEPLWEAHRRDLAFLTDFAVKFRYPGESADKKTALRARTMCGSFIKTVRASMNLRKRRRPRR
ncbi:MAG: HEPN domain-containing protein [Elusimicrobia bacterium]|nr:HEPN domain-containing protein [Elusimicrobiota bacterium]